MMNNMTATTMPVVGVDTIFTKDILKVVSGSFSLLVPCLFLIVGFFVSLQFAPAGASAIMNWATKNKGKALAGGLAALSKGTAAVGNRIKPAAERLQASNNPIGQELDGC